MRSAVPFRSFFLIVLFVLSAFPPLLAQEADLETPPFAAIHAAYRELDEPTYTRLVRGALREARRLLPAACVQRQRELAAAARVLGFDGLEPLWLIYQDCAAQQRGTSLIPARTESMRTLREILRYAGKPAPQLPLRVSHWNSVFERGVRGEAVRKVLEGYAQSDPARAQGWSLRNALAQSQVKSSLCGIAPRFDQHGKIAAAELLRQGQCLTGEIGPAEICEKLELGKGGSLPGMSQTDTDRLKDLCDNLGSGAGAVGGGIDLLDGFSTDQCTGEDETYLYETEEIAQLVQDCYMSDGEGNPLALGPTDVGIVRNRRIEWENAGTANAFITIGEGKEGDHYHGTGNTPEEARERLEKQLADASLGKDAEGNSILQHREWEEDNGDGTKDTISETVSRSPDGESIITQTSRTNADGSSYSIWQKQNQDGSSETRTVGVDEDGNSTTTESKTDKEGNTTFTTVHRDADGNETGRAEGTIGRPDPESGDENHFDAHNPACQKLATLGTIPGSNRGAFWDQLLERGRHVDPRKVYPNPDEAGSQEEPLCGAPGVGNTNAPAKCMTPVLCAEGTELDDSCTCSRPAGGRIALRGCFAANCPPDTAGRPVGMNACVCSPGEAPPEDPIPLPDVADLYFSELVWNRSDGRVFVTEEMAGDGRLPSEPPR